MSRRRTAPPGPQRGGLRRIVLWSVASLAVLALLWTLAVGWALPRVLQPRLEAAASATLGAPFTIGRLEIAPWRLAVVASDLRLGPAASPWLRVARVEADASSISFLRLAPVLERVRIEGPSLSIERLAPGRFNLSPLLEALARRPSAPDDEKPQRFALHNLRLEGGTIHFADRVAKSEHAVEALQVGVPFLSNLPADIAIDVEPLLAARIDGSPLRLSGRTQPFNEGRRSSLDIDWRDVDLARWLEALGPWLPPALPVALQRGRLETALRIDFEQRDGGRLPLLRIGGRLALTDVDARMPALGLGLASPRLELEGLDLRPLERRVALARIRWPGPALELDVPTLLGRKAAGPGSAEAAAPDTASSSADPGRASPPSTAAASTAAGSEAASVQPGGSSGPASGAASGPASGTAPRAASGTASGPTGLRDAASTAARGAPTRAGGASSPTGIAASNSGAAAASPEAAGAGSGPALGASTAAASGIAAPPAAVPASAAAPGSPGRPGGAASSPSGAPADGAWQWRVGGIELTEGLVRMRHPAWPDGRTLAPLGVQIEGLESGADAPDARLALALSEADGTRLSVEGGLSPARRAAQLKLDLAGLRLASWVAPWQDGLPVRLLDGALSLRAALDGGASGWSVRDGSVRLDALRLEPVGAYAAASAGPARKPRGGTQRRGSGPAGGAPADRLAVAAFEAGGVQVEGRTGEAPVVRVASLALEGLEAQATRRPDGGLAWLGSPAAEEGGPAERHVGIASRSRAGSSSPRAASPTGHAPPSEAPSISGAASRPQGASASGTASPTMTGPGSEAASGSGAPPSSGQRAAAGGAPDWRIGELRCTACSLALHDASLRPSAAFGLKDVRLVLRGVGADPAQAIGFELAGRSLGDGRLKASGRARPQPLDVRGRLDVEALDLRGLQPYLEPHLNMALASARAHAAGELQVQGDARQAVASARWRGRLALADVRALDRQNDTDFLRWRSLRLDGSDLRWTPARVDADLGDVTIDGFFGRVIINPDGRLNLQDIVRREGETGERSITTPSQAAGAPDAGADGSARGASQAASAPPSDGAEPKRGDAATASASPVRPALAPAPASAAMSSASAAAAAPAPGPAAAPASATATAIAAAPHTAASGPHLRWRGIRLADSAVDFTDHFIRPNYDARLVDLQGDVAGLAWDDPQPAALRLSGKVDGSAPLEIAGSVHPLGPRLATDITASARGIDITRLSGYSGRYAGYGIQKGTLSLQVHYKLHNGQLEAQNKLYLDQLTFGGKVDSPDALKLPVLLAVSLLKDRNGVIDIDLPIRGSLDDPQFSIGGIIVRVIVNLVAKAVTAPFSLLARAFGGGEELGHVDFAPGSSELDDAARARLDKLAHALGDRPALRLEATGHADPAVDEAALRRRHVERLLRTAKARELGELPDGVAIEPSERARWLEAAYKAAELPAKPRNVLGLAKRLPPEEMEALLLDAAPGGEAALRALADQRGDRVKAYLVGKIAPERVLLSASRVGGAGHGGSRADAAGAARDAGAAQANVAKTPGGAREASAGSAGSSAGAPGAGTSDSPDGSMASAASGGSGAPRAPGGPGDPGDPGGPGGPRAPATPAALAAPAAGSASDAPAASGAPGGAADPASGPRVDFTLK